MHVISACRNHSGYVTGWSSHFSRASPTESMLQYGVSSAKGVAVNASANSTPAPLQMRNGSSRVRARERSLTR